jgi:DNA-binding transcriptional LysR family regulator
MVELKQLQQLIAIAENETVSKAAEILHISQPALSLSIQRLETELEVTLFDRTKNKITLNENGMVALEHAKKIISDAKEMHRHVKAFDKSKHTISIGSCAPGPMWRVLPVLPTIFPDFTISSDLKDLDELEAGFENDTYQIIFMPYKSPDKNIVSKEILHEDLCFYLHKSHRLANKKTLSMKELDGETMLLFSQIGFWHSLPKEKMPNSNFLMQDERYTFSELVKASTIPAFTSNIAKPAYPDDEGRVIIPIEDKEASVTFYLWYKERDKNKFQPLWNSLYL